MKLAIVGGGGFRTPFVWQALIRDNGNPRVTEVALYDLDASRLGLIRGIFEQLADGFNHVPRVTLHTELEEALAGADFVFAAIRVGGTLARWRDEEVALELGVLGQETTGPGGLSYALRTIPVMRHIAEVTRRVAPNAYFLNFTNPAGIITEVVQSVLGDRALGICDSPSGLGRRVAAVLGADHTRVQMDYVGLNHLGWMRRVLVDGVDLLPALLADDEKLGRLEEAQIFGTEWIRDAALVPNEYLYYYYFNRDAVANIRRSPQTRGHFLHGAQAHFFDAAKAALSEAAHIWEDSVAERGASYMAEAKGGVQGAPGTHAEHEVDPAELGYAGVALEVMTAISRGEPATLILNVRNRGAVAGLPDDAVVEVATLVDANGVHPLTLDTQPDLHQLGLMQQVKAVERHIIAAALSSSRSEALKAFALHPLVDSATVAQKLLDGYIDRIPEVAAVFERERSLSH